MNKIYVTVIDMALEDFDELENYRKYYSTLGFNILFEEGPTGWPEVEVFGPMTDLLDFLEDIGYEDEMHIKKME